MRLPRLAPAQALSVSIIGLILLGTFLLSLPVSWAEGQQISLIDAFFTATSAVCVTGLIVVDTPNAFSIVGQLAVLLLIQAGGLGYMVITTLVGVALGKRLSLQERLTLQEALNIESREGLIRFTLAVFEMTLVFELAGALVLGLWWWGDMGPRAFYMGLFHAVSAFNNAGFALFSDNLLSFDGDLVVNLVISTLVIVGGLGFVVLRELLKLRGRVKLSLHTRLVLTLTGVLIAGGAIAIYALERGNPGTLGQLPGGQAMLAAYFQSVTTRTAGFNTINIGLAREPTLFLMMALMFIGASPGGTGGGVKTTTFGLTVAALWGTVRGRDEAVLFGRRIPAPLVARAFFISLIAFLALNVVAGLTLITESQRLLSVLFETTSAFGTVGLSTGLAGSPLSLAGHFGTAGKLLMVAMMFMGRVGPLTLAVALARSHSRPKVRYPEGRVLIG
jgi:trk system potassium uptake protein